MSTPSSREVLLALDLGEARIGVAISRSGVIAEPLEIIHRTGRRQALDAIQRLVEANHATTCVVGLPLLESGAEGEQAERTRAFVRSMARRLPALRIVFQDERDSSNEADEIRSHRAPSREHRDHLAAAVILRDYLEHRTEREKKPQEHREHDAAQ